MKFVFTSVVSMFFVAHSAFALLGAGTKDFDNEKFPFLNSFVNMGEFGCGGAFVTSSTILTAKHCVKRWKKPLEVILQDGQIIRNKDIGEISFPGERSANGLKDDHDIALIQISSENYGKYFTPICDLSLDDLKSLKGDFYLTGNMRQEAIGFENEKMKSVNYYYEHRSIADLPKEDVKNSELAFFSKIKNYVHTQSYNKIYFENKADVGEVASIEMLTVDGGSTGGDSGSPLYFVKENGKACVIGAGPSGSGKTPEGYFTGYPVVTLKNKWILEHL